MRNKCALAVITLLLLGTLAWSSGTQAETTETTASAGADLTLKEAPVLAAMVKAGTIPKLEDRLPDNPMVVTPFDEPGRYGGTWRRAWRSPRDTSAIKKVVSQRLVRFTPDVTEIIPNIAEKWEASDGGRVFTMFLRKNIKWSDGDLFDADDFVWWNENIHLNKELNANPWSWLTVGGEPVKITKVDQFTVRFTFAQPYGLFLAHLAASEGYNIIHPSHYLKQFHVDFAPKADLDKKIKDAGFDQWTQLMSDRTGNNRYLLPGHPTLNPWIATTDPSSSRFVLERNPYFWKVDTEGRQLPYIDRVTHDLVPDKEVINLKASSGELDFQFRHLSPTNFTLFKENEAKGGYRTLAYVTDQESRNIIGINLASKDLGHRETVGDPRFRKGLSHALNRNDINELVHGGLAGEPSQVQPFPNSPFHLPSLAKAYTEYSPDKANAYLDDMGLTRRDADGFRLRLDGQPLTLSIQVTDADGNPDVAELVKEYWQAVGVKTSVRVIERSLWQQRHNANDSDVTMWGGAAGTYPLTWCRYYVPTGGQVIWAPGWQHWYESGGASGVEPADYMKEAIALYEEIKVTTDPGKQAELFREILKLKEEYLWDIGTTSPPPPTVGVVNKNLRNFPDSGTYSDIARFPHSIFPEQFFFVE